SSGPRRRGRCSSSAPARTERQTGRCSPADHAAVTSPRRGCSIKLAPMVLRLTAALLGSLVLASAAQAATWSPPRMTGATQLQLTTDRTWSPLDSKTDYVLRLPAGGYDRGGLTIDGGRNVTLIGGHIWVPETGAKQLRDRRGLLLVNQHGIVHVEGLQIDGPG